VSLQIRAHFIYKEETVRPFTYTMQSIKILFLIISLFGATSCGTARGVLYGAGTVLEGMATDARTVGNWIK